MANKREMYEKNKRKVAKLEEKYGLYPWWADEVACGGMTLEEAIESQKTRDKIAEQLRESAEPQESASAEELIQNIKISASIH